ncbi:FAD:protein FMN transferase [Planctomycetota bacterium]
MKTDRLVARAFLVSCITSFMVGFPSGPAGSAEIVEFSGSIMGTTYSIKIGTGTVGIQPLDPISSPTIDSPRAYLGSQIEARLTGIDQQMSTYKDDSDVSRFNQSPANEWFTVPTETAIVVRKALAISKQTNGAFDITVGPLVRLWSFGPGSDFARTVPSDSEIKKAKSKTGYANIEVRMEPPALRKTIDSLEVDLSGIAKGYAVDEVANLLASENITDYLVEIGGEIRTSGQRAAGKSTDSRWTVGIESPQSDRRTIDKVLTLSNSSIASSGDYRNFFEIDGVRYSHTIDPRTGRPVQHAIAAVTILSEDCATADALATALLVMGNDAKTYAEQSNIQALFFERTSTEQTNTSGNRFATHRSSTFPPIESLTAITPAHRAVPATSYWRMLAASVIIIGIALIAMAIGVIFGNRCIKGSCGGMEGLTDEHGRPLCEGCSTPSAECTTDPSRREHVN